MCYPLDTIVGGWDLIVAGDHKRLYLKCAGNLVRVCEKYISGVKIDFWGIHICDSALQIFGCVDEVFANKLNLQFALVGSVSVRLKFFDSNRRVKIQSWSGGKVLRIVSEEKTGRCNTEVCVSAELVDIWTLYKRCIEHNRCQCGRYVFPVQISSDRTVERSIWVIWEQSALKN